MEHHWTARIAGLRMQLDGEFTDRVAESELNPQQWSLVMTATEFEIENPETPEEARIVANTENLSAVAGEMRRIEQEGFTTVHDSTSDRGILRWVADKFEREVRGSVEFDEAEDLADEYATRLQEEVVAADRWVEVCEAVASEADSPT